MLADKLEVSRTPVSDALVTLHSEGFVDYAPHRGYVVKTFGIDDLMNAFDVRINLEGLASRRVAERGLNEGQTARLEANLKQSETCLFTGEWTKGRQAEWRQLNLDFHDLFLEAADNGYLTTAVESARSIPHLHDVERKPVPNVQGLYSLDETRNAYRDHARIAEAVVSGQSERAENMMKEHIFTNREAMRKHLSSRSEGNYILSGAIEG